MLHISIKKKKDSKLLKYREPKFNSKHPKKYPYKRERKREGEKKKTTHDDRDVKTCNPKCGCSFRVQSQRIVITFNWT